MLSHGNLLANAQHNLAAPATAPTSAGCTCARCSTSRASRTCSPARGSARSRSLLPRFDAARRARDDRARADHPHRARADDARDAARRAGRRHRRPLLAAPRPVRGLADLGRAASARARAAAGLRRRPVLRDDRGRADGHPPHARGPPPRRPSASPRSARPVPGVEVEVRRCPRAGEPGELWIRGPNIMLGYWKRPDATADALVDGWYRSGDIVSADEHGYLYMVDRAKDMIITGGENVYSLEIEAVLAAPPGGRRGGRLRASPTTAGARPSTRSSTLREPRHRRRPARRTAAGTSPASRSPREIELRDEPLPKSGAGKVLKTAAARAVLGGPRAAGQLGLRGSADDGEGAQPTRSAGASGSARRGRRGAPAPDRGGEPARQRRRPGRRRARARAGARGRRARASPPARCTASRSRSRTTSRRPGIEMTIGAPERAGRRPRPRRDRGRADARGRRDPARQDELPHLRRRDRDRQPGLRPHQQPLRPRRARPAAAPAARRPRSRPAARPAASGPTRARACACPPTSAGSRRSSRPAAASRSPASSTTSARSARSATRAPRSASSPARPTTSPCSSAPSPAPTAATAAWRPCRSPSPATSAGCACDAHAQRPRHARPRDHRRRPRRRGAPSRDAGATIEEAEPPRGGHELTIDVWRSYGDEFSAEQLYALLRRWDAYRAEMLAWFADHDLDPLPRLPRARPPPRRHEPPRRGRPHQLHDALLPHRLARRHRPRRQLARGPADRRPARRPPVARRRRARRRRRRSSARSAATSRPPL